MFDDAGKSDHREFFAKPGAIKLKRSQDWEDMKLCFSAPSKLDHYCMTIQIWDLDSSIICMGEIYSKPLNPFEHQKMKNPVFVDICED